MARVHDSYHTLVHIGTYGTHGEYSAAPPVPQSQATYQYETFGPNDWRQTGFSDTVEHAFREAWTQIVAHEDEQHEVAINQD